MKVNVKLNGFKSELEKIKIEKEISESAKSIRRVDRRWTTIWLATIFVYVVLGTTFVFAGFNNASFGMFIGTILSVVFLYQHKLTVEDQMNRIKEAKRLKDRIVDEIKQQEILEKEIAEIEYKNKQTINEIWNYKEIHKK